MTPIDANPGSGSREIVIEPLEFLLSPQPLLIISALKKGDRTLADLAGVVGGRALATYYLPGLERLGVVSEYYKILKMPEEGKQGKAVRMFKLHPGSVIKYVEELLRSPSYNKLVGAVA